MQKFEREIMDVLKTIRKQKYMENSDVIDAIEHYVDVNNLEPDFLVFSEDFTNYVMEAAIKRNLIGKKFIPVKNSGLNELDI